MSRGHDRMKHRELLRATRVALVLVTGVWIARLLWHRGHADQPDIAVVVKPRPVPSQPIPAEEPPPIEPPPVEPPPPPIERSPAPVELPAPTVTREPRRVISARAPQMTVTELQWPLLVSLAIVLVAAAIWYAQFHQRADAATVQDSLGLRNPGSTIGCTELAANGSHWVCAIVHQAESDCYSVSVSTFGRVSAGRPAPDRCGTPPLERMLPTTITRTMVAADVTRIVGGSPFICAAVGKHSSRWACARATPTSVECQVVRVVPWAGLRPKPGGNVCRSAPYLRATVIG